MRFTMVQLLACLLRASSHHEQHQRVLIKASCVDLSEVDGAILENFGELPSSFVPRVTGTAKKEERLGQVNDFAAYTAKTPFQVMVVDSRNIWSDSDADLRKLALRTAEIKTDTEFVKSRVRSVTQRTLRLRRCSKRRLDPSSVCRWT